MNIQHIRKIAVFAGITLISTSFLLNSGCSKKAAEQSKAATGPGAPSVIVETIEQRTVPIYSEYVGQTKAEETVELRARVEGILQKVYFREGTPVRKGQLFSPSTSARSRRLFNRQKRSSRNRCPIWPRRDNEPTCSRRRQNWPTRRRCIARPSRTWHASAAGQEKRQ